MKGETLDVLIKVALAIGFVFSVTNPQVSLFCAQVVTAVGDFFVGWPFPVGPVARELAWLGRYEAKGNEIVCLAANQAGPVTLTIGYAFLIVFAVVTFVIFVLSLFVKGPDVPTKVH